MMRAMDFVCANRAGMMLAIISGDYGGEWGWLGTKEQWEVYYDAVHWVEENNSYPWAI